MGRRTMRDLKSLWIATALAVAGGMPFTLLAQAKPQAPAPAKQSQPAPKASQPAAKAAAAPAAQKPAPAPAKQASQQPAKAPAPKAAAPAAKAPAAKAPAAQAKAPAPKPAAPAPTAKTPAAKAPAPAAKAAAPKPAAPAAAQAKAPAPKAAPKAAAQKPAAKPKVKAAKAAAPAAEKPEAEVKIARRDPFESLIGRQQRQAQAVPSIAGKPGLVIGSLRLDGIVRAPNGMIAVVTNPQQRTYFLREGDQLYDGRVEKITMDSVSFHEVGKDAFGKPVERQVNKRIYPSPGEQQ
jgi:Tfp pilus assembly protein PilP